MIFALRLASVAALVLAPLSYINAQASTKPVATPGVASPAGHLATRAGATRCRSTPGRRGADWRPGRPIPCRSARSGLAWHQLGDHRQARARCRSPAETCRKVLGVCIGCHARIGPGLAGGRHSRRNGGDPGPPSGGISIRIPDRRSGWSGPGRSTSTRGRTSARSRTCGSSRTSSTSCGRSRSGTSSRAGTPGPDLRCLRERWHDRRPEEGPPARRLGGPVPGVGQPQARRAAFPGASTSW